jgi:hypothetical protein
MANPRFFQSRRRSSDDFVLPEHFSRKRNREVALPKVHSICIRCKSDIDSVIHNQGHARFPAHGNHAFCHLDHAPCGPAFFSELNDVRAPGNPQSGQFLVRKARLQHNICQKMQSSNSRP